MTGARVGCALLVWPFLELFLLLWAASTWGWESVVLIVLASFLAGLIVIRIGARATGRSWSQALRTLQQRETVIDPDTKTVLSIESGMEGVDPPPMTPPAQTMLLIPAGIALAIPGFLSDIGGVVLVLPPVRRAIAARWAAGFRPR